ncbi:16615_t:CDS:2 [Cetraspora pellucida]|uniref:16615_t:CDS:1 n=1 Tax=Cetraspora pellucida TaxID=1433469 RepID=A0A9N9FW67_9GLOM|nr:16615_t:CDS:2 [Cetraspora pellucida]
MKNNIIFSDNTEWGSSALVITKKDRTKKIAIDYRNLNKYLEQYKEPLPNFKQMLQTVNFARVATPLYGLEETAEFNWTDNCQKAIEELKQQKVKKSLKKKDLLQSELNDFSKSPRYNKTIIKIGSHGLSATQKNWPTILKEIIEGAQNFVADFLTRGTTDKLQQLEELNIETTPNNQNNSKRRNSSNVGTASRRIQYPTTINSKYQKYQTETWHKKTQRSSKKDSRGLKETSNKFQFQTKFGRSISEVINLTETEQSCQLDTRLSEWNEESVSQKTLDNNDKPWILEQCQYQEIVTQMTLQLDSYKYQIELHINQKQLLWKKQEVYSIKYALEYLNNTNIGTVQMQYEINAKR